MEITSQTTHATSEHASRIRREVLVLFAAVTLIIVLAGVVAQLAVSRSAHRVEPARPAIVPTDPFIAGQP